LGVVFRKGLAVNGDNWRKGRLAWAVRMLANIEIGGMWRIYFE